MAARRKPSEKATCPCCGKSRGAAGGTPLLEQEEELRRQDADPWRRTAGWSVEAARSGRLQWACNRRLRGGRAIRGNPALQTYCDYEPYFAYFDMELTCADCGRKFVFSAREQQFWYESLKFWVQSRPKQCAACRRVRRRAVAEQRQKRKSIRNLFGEK